MRSLLAVLVTLMLVPSFRAQVPAISKHLEFDVASIKQNKAAFGPSGIQPRSNFPLGPGDMYASNGGTFSAVNQPLWVYIMFAYKMTDHEVRSLRKQLPSWALQERYDIEAKSDMKNATKDEMRLMMQSLLAERLKLAVHNESETVPVYTLVLAKPGKLGPKLRPHPANDHSCSNAVPQAPSPNAPPSPLVPGLTSEGFPIVCGGAVGLPSNISGRLDMGYRNVPLKLIALQMSAAGGLDRPVIDGTGLDGNYDFAIEFTPQRSTDASSSADVLPEGPTYQQALLEQAGLKLVPQKASVENVVIDHIEHPSPN
jgi:uncharacterized protein (TIGR03435 family)